MTPLLAFEVSPQFVVIGALSGLAYAVLASGLVLVYRATRVVNFAHGQIGAFCAAVLAKLVLDLDWPYAVAFMAMAAFGGLIGAAVELGVIRRLAKAPPVMLLVATIGVAQLLLFLELRFVAIDQAGAYPTAFRREWAMGDLLLLGQHFTLIAFVPAAVAGLSLFLGRTPYGRAIRAAADDPDGVRLLGISAKRVSIVVWVLAGVLAAVTAILLNPVRGVVPGAASAALGPTLLLRALTAALVGRMTSLPLTLVGGVAVGVVEALLYANVEPATTDLVLFVAVLLLVLGGSSARRGDDVAAALASSARAVPAAVRAHPVVRRVRRGAMAAAVVAVLALPLVLSRGSQVFLFSHVAVFTLAALSLTVLTGWAGQLSLGQYAIVGVGAYLTAALTARGVPFAVAGGWAVVGGVAVAVVVGLPALRIRGLFLAVTTLAFAVAAATFLFRLDVLDGGRSSQSVARPVIGPVDFGSQRAYYYLCVAVVAVAVALVSRLRRSGVGRTLLAVRDNERAAAAYGLSPTRAKLVAFAVSGGLAATAGVLLAGLLPDFRPDEFATEQSLRVVSTAVIGGMGSVVGAVLGASWILGLPALFPGVKGVSLLTSSIGLLLLVLYLPGGLVSLLHRARDAVYDAVVRRFPAADPPAVAAVPAARRPAVARVPQPVVADVPALRAADIVVRFGGRVAVDHVSFEVGVGETVGLIGTNGAGKSTLLNAVSGFVPHGGRVELFGHDLAASAPHERARLGMGRVFQDARLFGDLTVSEAVRVAQERRGPTEVVPVLLGLAPSRRAEQRKQQVADELLAMFGLGRWADARIASLSTGTRRVVELACLLALDCRMLLLDEPTAGVAQREVEAFGPLVRRIARDLGASVVVIEHDMPLVMAMSDRIYCLEAGGLIAEGPPAMVAADPRVVASYLGTDERVVQRSNQAAS